MFFQHVYDKTLAQASYFIGCQKAGVAAVIDPKRDIDTYLEIAKQNNMQITHIFETHIHADFLTGSRELAAVTGAKMYLSDEGGPGWEYEFPHEGLKHQSEVMVGNLKIQVLHTPGHTPESISFLLTDTPASKEPVMLFTGDFVFVGDIGRPDLLEKAAGIAGTQDKGAEQMYIMGIVSITPRLDYSQGNKWDIHLKTMDDFHKPQLDEIGFQELITEQMAWWDTTLGSGNTWVTRSAGKQPAWINYMTNYNKVYGNFAIQSNEMYMVLTRRYEYDFGGLTIKDLTTYIDPRKFNHIFAETSGDAMNFWTQISVDMKVRRKMSAKLMPNL